jgi:hypothetical protein
MGQNHSILTPPAYVTKPIGPRPDNLNNTTTNNSNTTTGNVFLGGPDQAFSSVSR